MPECIKCKAYSKYEGGLCLECYKKEKPGVNADSAGLNEKDKEYRYGMIKGRIAET